MLLRTIFFTALLYVPAVSLSQNTTNPAAGKKTSGSAHTSAFSCLDRDTCLGKRFSVVFYGVSDSASTRTAAMYSMFVDSVLNIWNRGFSRICVSFQNCSTVIIPNYELNSWEYPKTDKVVIKDWYTENTINVYLPDILEAGPGHESAAYAYAKPLISGPAQVPVGAHQSTLSVIVIETVAMSISLALTKDVMHAMGHFLGLPDTFGETGVPATPTSTNTNVYSTEFVDGTNSAVNGDKFTDTEADCFPGGLNMQVNVSTLCSYGKNVKDGKGQYYNPPVDNFMSKWGCGCRFTQQQFNYMAWYIINYRMNLH